jgi:VWFA-related protein
MRAEHSPDDSFTRYSLWAAAAILLSAGVVGLRGAEPQKPEPAEVSTEETQPHFTIQVRRNEVLVRVLVRDAKGQTVANLTKNDFRLFDNGKEQPISSFTVENFRAMAAGAPPSVRPAPEEAEAESQPAAGIAQRFTAFFFDDLFMSFEDIVRTRTAAERYLESALQPTDRAGIFTSSGLGIQDFTADRERLHEAMAKLSPRPKNVGECPPLTPYEAYMVVEREDPEFIRLAVLEYIACACGGNPNACMGAEAQAKLAARYIWEYDQLQSRQSLRVLTSLVRELGARPGQRNILWLSQGFIAVTQHQYLSELTNQALRDHVVINALDSQGLWAFIPGGDASEDNLFASIAVGDPGAAGRLAASRLAGREGNDEVMAEVSHDTGGVFVHNTNDYEGGFRKAGGLPEFAYLLAFTPLNLKYDGKFHKLRVELVGAKGLTVQARNGYYAPKLATDPAALAEQKIEEAVFSTEELSELPIEVETQFFKLDAVKARLAITARIDMHSLHLHKEGDRNLDDLKLVFAVFDRDGSLVMSARKHLELRLRDQNLARLMGTGLRVGSHFEVAAGTYLLRVVVSETGTGQVSAVSKTLEIPF